MHRNAFSKASHKALLQLKGLAISQQFVLAGGSGLALQLGHRISVDLDFFTRRPFSPEKLFQKIKQLGISPIVQQEEEGTLTIIVSGVKVSFFHYPYPFRGKMAVFNGIQIANVIDIASMKTMAISQRGAKRDFVDLYFILQEIPFHRIAENMVMRFGRDRINPVHIGKSLVYFNDADVDPEPSYCGKDKPDWERIKRFFLKNVQQMVISLNEAVSSH